MNYRLALLLLDFETVLRTLFKLSSPGVGNNAPSTIVASRAGTPPSLKYPRTVLQDTEEFTFSFSIHLCFSPSVKLSVTLVYSLLS